jgi:formate dehydrogenase maturation protein FdhE
MKSIEEIEEKAREAYEKQPWKDETTSFYPFWSGWLQSEYNNVYKTVKAEVEATVLEMENYTESYCEQLKDKGYDAMFIQNTRSSMQHAIIMMRYYLVEKFGKI